MKLINHLLISTAITAAINPISVPTAILGSVFPDIGERMFKMKNHRKETHYVLYWAFATLCTFYIYDYNGILFGFFFGGLIHVLADSMTPTGVPFSPWSESKLHLFGGKVRIGSQLEYVISFAVVVICGFIIYRTNFVSVFSPYFFPWSASYQEGFVDGYEWRVNRFKLF